MKRLVILFGIIFLFFLTLINATPSVEFNSPTPSNGYSTAINNVGLNFTISNSQNLTEFIWYWQGTNYTFFDSTLVLMLNLNNNSAIGENNTHVVDSSIYGNNGTVINGALPVSAKYNGGFNLFQDNQSINFSDFEGFRSSNFTISFWVNLTKYNIKQVSAFGTSTCILLQSGELYCVGSNTNGLLGIGSTENSDIPIKVSGDYNFSSIGGNSGYPANDHICGILTNGSTMCWGDNSLGELGNGTVGGAATVPQPLSEDFNFSQIAIGRDGMCGLLQNYSLLCWGRNTEGQLGNGTTGGATGSPQAISGDYEFHYISGGDYAFCGLLENGSALCWGRNERGALGDGTVVDKDVPTPVSGDFNFSGIYGGNEKFCGILTNGSSMCWGASGSGGYIYCGELGNGGCTDSSVPVFVSGNHNFSYLESHYAGFSGILTNGSVVSWGGNSIGIIGDNTTEARLVPTFTVEDYNFSSISVGNTHICGLSGGNIFCWGSGVYGKTGSKTVSSSFSVPILFGYGDSSNYSLVLGGNTACSILTNGSAMCWGRNDYGQAGVNTSQNEDIPKFVSGGYNFSDIQIAGFHTCGLLTNGTALCWGYNNYGQLGNGSIGGSALIPIALSGEYNFAAVSVGNSNSCGLLTNGTALCWGYNNNGQLGNGSTGGATGTPQAISGNFNFSSIFVSYIITCGLLTNGTALCWGDNAYGQLGNGNSPTDSNVPAPVSGDYNFSNLALGNNHICGLLTNGTALCWGYNNYGQLGNGSIGGSASIPIALSGDWNFSLISASGGQFSCGILVNGSAMCWGLNSFGTVGDGTYTNRNVPTFVLSGTYNFSSLVTNLRASFGYLTDGRIVSWGDNTYGQQAFSSFNNNIPQSNFYKGDLFGKSVISFSISSTFNGGLKFFVTNTLSNLELDEEYNYITLTFDGTTAKIYKNGILNESFTSRALAYPTDESPLYIGNNTNGTIDEIMMWNRTLSASEISELYSSKIERVSYTDWTFYSNKTLEVGTYYYQIFVSNLVGSYNTLRRVLYIIEPAVSASSSGTTSESNIFYPKSSQLEKGYKVNLREDSKVIIEGATLTLNNLQEGSATLEIAGEEYSIDENGEIKIDTDSDGYYDLQVTAGNINEVYATLTFRTIFEPVLIEENKGLVENITEDIGNLLEENKWIWIIIGIVGLSVLIFAGRWMIKKK